MEDGLRLKGNDCKLLPMAKAKVSINTYALSGSLLPTETYFGEKLRISFFSHFRRGKSCIEDLMMCVQLWTMTETLSTAETIPKGLKYQ